MDAMTFREKSARARTSQLVVIQENHLERSNLADFSRDASCRASHWQTQVQPTERDMRSCRGVSHEATQQKLALLLDKARFSGCTRVPVC